MTNSGSSPEPSKKGFKVTLVQGVIGAASLAGTTAIPLMVQRLVAPPAPVISPAPVPTQVTPSPQMQSTLGGSGEIKASDNDNDHPGKGKGRKKNKQDD